MNITTPIKTALLFSCYLISIMGCSSSNLNTADPSKPWFFPQVGAKLVLHQPLTLKPDSAALYIQQGKVTGSKHSRFDPYCKIRVRDVMAVERTILPDTFTITGSGQQTELIAGLSGIAIPLNVGSIRPRFGFLVSSSDAPSDITETIVMNLSSAKQPDVLNMVCGGVEDHPANAEPPTFMEMKEALGAIMSFKIL